jgi:hypothetical protein
LLAYHAVKVVGVFVVFVHATSPAVKWQHAFSNMQRLSSGTVRSEQRGRQAAEGLTL